MSNPIEVLRKQFETDTGSKACVALADALYRDGQLLEAIDVCLRGLSSNAQNDAARLLLAKLFSERGYNSFAAREVVELLRRFPESQPLKKLLEKLSPDIGVVTGDNSAQETIAEAEIDFGDIQVLHDEAAGKES